MGRRQVTSTITMTVLVALLVVGAVSGWRFLFGDMPGDAESSAEPSPACTTDVVDPGQRIRARDVRVSVFNAGNRSGLAGKTLEALERRGFRPGQTANAPSDVEVRRVQVWSTIENDPQARLVARQFGRSVKVRFSDEDLGPGVDVIVGNAYRGLVKAPRKLRIKQEQQVCVPVSRSATPG